ncbi:insulinase family protein [Microcoleus sp. FACHB-1515]|uniref:M16 family metallopeptidase n=1 Tax=Cyanophyceae TaxID=3028117 RepID=UPI0016871B57|nr:pitrilysin family protein [Microcoleus sp. FACHB-1515]MBD2092812.1 insulinase family protein [Microcoleus sp. FACHB-1515]
MTSTLFESAAGPRLNAPTLHRLPNGLTIVAEQMPIEAVNLSLWLGVGSAIEADAINGMAHFLEHMIFKGTACLQSGEFERRIEQRGAVTNAATSHDYTHFYITTAPQDFADLAPLLIEIVRNASIADETFDRERSVILEEIRRAEDTPRRRVYNRSMQLAFDRLPYRRPVLGTSAIVEQLTAEQMRDFHQTWYQPQSMTAVAVGNLPVDRLIQIVVDGFARTESSYSSRSTSTLTLPDLSPEPPFIDIQREELIDPSLQQARMMLMWRVPGMDDLQQTDAIDILAYILGQGRTARLMRDLREERHLVTGISASNMTFTRQGLFHISAQLSIEHLATVEAAILDHIRRLQAEPVTPTEISRIRTLVANRYVFSSETPSDRAGLYGYYQSVVGDLKPAIDYPARIQALSPDALQAAAQQYLSPDAYRLLIVKPS